jgi:homopolymeric O-antigen transport system permease protein
MRRTNLFLALRDIEQGVAAVQVWWTLSWQEVQQRYRRSMLGPFWLTLSTAIMIVAIGPLYGRLLNQDSSTYFTYIAIGLIVWQAMAGLATDSCQAFIAAEDLIKQVKLPLAVHVMRVVSRNVIMLAHNFVVVVVVLVFARPPLGISALLVPVAILLIAVNGLWLGLLLGPLCARFRDIPQVVTSLVQVAFFLTPVLWPAGMLGRHDWAATYNPLYHFLEIVRGPLLGQPFATSSWIAVLSITVAGYAGALAFFARFRARIAYWV